MLFHAGVIKKMGRVDKEDSFLDYDIQERKRGITIFSKEISFMYRESQMTFLDTTLGIMILVVKWKERYKC